MEIFQIELKFQPAEDRVLLRLNSKENEELRFLLTRRFVRAVWPVLEKVLASDPSFASFDEQTQQAAMAFMQQQVLSTVDEAQPFSNDATHFPLGETPILLTKISLKLNDKQKMILGLYPEEGQGIEIERGHPLVNYFYEHLPKISQEAEWDLTLLPITLHSFTDVKPDKLH